MEHIELLEQLRPWDCEQFPKSKNICFGGGGGDPITKAVKAVTKPINEVGAGVSNVTSKIVDPVAQGASSIMDPVASGLGNVGSGITEGISSAVEGIGGGIDTIGQGVKSVTDPVAGALHGAMDRNLGSESAFGRAMSANMGSINQGIGHNLGEFWKGMDFIGSGLMHNIKQIGNIPKLFQGGGGGGGASAGAGGGVMGKSTGGLQRLGASKLQMKKAGMGRRQTYLTKG